VGEEEEKRRRVEKGERVERKGSERVNRSGGNDALCGYRSRRRLSVVIRSRKETAQETWKSVGGKESYW
jgi:hypothetical protein